MRKQIKQFTRVCFILLVLFLPRSEDAAAKVVPSPENVRSIAGEGYIDIHWDSAAALSPDDQAAGYKVYKRKAGRSFNEANVFFTNANSYRDSRVVHGATYFYGVKTVYASGALSDSYAESGESYFRTTIKTYTDVNSKKKPTPFQAMPTTAAVGDLNKDGKADLILGIPKLNKVKIYLGCKLSILPSITLSGEAAGDDFGHSLAVADLDKDGYEDLIIGAPSADTGAKPNIVNEAGKVYIYRGARRFRSTPALILRGSAAHDRAGAPYSLAERLGTSIAGVGDINGDRYPDVAIGAPFGGVERSGRVLLLRGGATIAGRTSEVVFPTAMKRMGQSLAAAGDVNGDGHNDVVIGGENYSASAGGEVRLLYGGASFTLSNVLFAGRDGCSPLVAGLNINGDAYSDIAVGCSSGADIYYGGHTLSSQPDVSFPVSGGVVTPLGDLDKDGFNDLMLGFLLVHFGSSLADNVPDILTSGYGESAQRTLIGVGDINGDGSKEILVSNNASGYVHGHSLAAYLALPKITVNSHQDYGTALYESCQTISGSITGTVSRLLVAGSPVTPLPDGSFSRQVCLKSGLNTFEILAETTNRNVSKRTINIEFAPPPQLMVQITSPADGAIVSSTPITVAGTVSDPSATVTVNNVAVSLTEGAFQADVNLTGGLNSITVNALDLYGQNASHAIHVELVYPTPTASLEATPSAIAPGESATLTWNSTNAETCSIAPEPGAVPLSGSTPVSPAQTTSYVITATGIGGTVTATATVTVINDSPIAKDDSATTDEDTPVTLNVLANDSAPDGYPLVISNAGQGLHGSVSINQDKTLTYSPSSNFHGTDSFAYSVIDSRGGSATAMVSMTVLPVNDPPVAEDDVGEALQGESISIDVLANDSDVDDDALQLAGFTQPGHGAVADIGNGTLRYASISGFSGEDAFTYTIQDSSGATSTASVIINVKSVISISIASPLNGETIAGSAVIVKGCITNLRNLETGVTVNDVVAQTFGNEFVANHTPLVEGENTLSITATDAAGHSATASLMVNAEPEDNHIEITANVESGLSPLEVTLSVSGSFHFEQSTMSYTGPGAVESLLSTPEEYKVSMTMAGIYIFTVEAADNLNNVHIDKIEIVVLDRDQIDNLLKAKWNGMKAALVNGERERALGYFIEGSQERYAEAFSALSDLLPGIGAEMREIQLIYAKGRVAKYRIRREEQVQGQAYDITYYIYFVRDPFGIWRIGSF